MAKGHGAYVDHVAIGVENKDAARDALLNLLGGAITWDDPRQNAHGFKGTIVEPGGTRLEILEATTPDSFVLRFLERRGPGLHHITFSCPNPDDIVERLTAAGIGVTGVERKQGHITNAFISPKAAYGIIPQLRPQTDYYPVDEEERSQHRIATENLPAPLPSRGRIDRVVLAVESIAPALAFYQDLFGGKVETPTSGVCPGEREVVLRWQGIGLGFAEPDGATSRLHEFLARRGPCGHHLVIAPPPGAPELPAGPGPYNETSVFGTTLRYLPGVPR